jgi:Arc/MetJ family transcription regulator
MPLFLWDVNRKIVAALIRVSCAPHASEDRSTEKITLRRRERSVRKSRSHPPKHTPHLQEMVYTVGMGRTNIEIDESLVRKARKLTQLKTKREIVDAALELLVRSESRKGILRHYGTGIWKGDLKAMRRNRARSKENL